jgi:hypothetical protein
MASDPDFDLHHGKTEELDHYMMPNTFFSVNGFVQAKFAYVRTVNSMKEVKDWYMNRTLQCGDLTTTVQSFSEYDNLVTNEMFDAYASADVDYESAEIQTTVYYPKMTRVAFLGDDSILSFGRMSCKKRASKILFEEVPRTHAPKRKKIQTQPNDSRHGDHGVCYETDEDFPKWIFISKVRHFNVNVTTATLNARLDILMRSIIYEKLLRILQCEYGTEDLRDRIKTYFGGQFHDRAQRMLRILMVIDFDDLD